MLEAPGRYMRRIGSLRSRALIASDTSTSSTAFVDLLATAAPLTPSPSPSIIYTPDGTSPIYSSKGGVNQGTRRHTSERLTD